jgi:hypothetical protein
MTLHRQVETNRYLSGIEQECRVIIHSIDRLTDTVGEGFAQVSDTLEDGFAAVDAGLERISQQLICQQTILRDIAELLRRPYEAKVLELRREADKWLTNGMKHIGRDRDEDWKDSARLLQTGPFPKSGASERPIAILTGRDQPVRPTRKWPWKSAAKARMGTPCLHPVS